MKHRPKDILTEIEVRLSNNDITNFYIGITDDWERRKIEHLQDRYSLGHPIATGDTDSIRQVEKELIAWVYSIFGFRIRRKCENTYGSGGEGADKVNILYIVAKTPFDDPILPRSANMQPLLHDFEPITL